MLIFLDIMDTPDKREKAERLYNKYKKLSLHEACSLLHNQEQAEDAVQDAFIKIMQNIDKIDEDSGGKTGALIVLITRNTAKDMLRREKRLEIVELEEAEPFLEDTIPPPLNQVVSQQGYEQLLQHIANLKDIYKIPCTMRLVYGLDEKTIANLLGLSPKVVNMRIFRGRNALKKAILEEKERLEQGFRE